MFGADKKNGSMYEPGTTAVRPTPDSSRVPPPRPSGFSQDSTAAQLAAARQLLELKAEADELGVPWPDHVEAKQRLHAQTRETAEMVAAMIVGGAATDAESRAPMVQRGQTCRRPHSRSRTRRARSPGRRSGDDPHDDTRPDVAQRIAAESEATTTCPRCAAKTVPLGLARTCPACHVEAFSWLWERLS